MREFIRPVAAALSIACLAAPMAVISTAIEFITLVMFTDARRILQIRQPENRARDRRGIGQSPIASPILRSCGPRIVGIAGVQIAATHNSVPAITKGYRERTSTGRTY